MEYSVFVPKPGFKYFDDYDDEDEDIRSGALPVKGESSPDDGPPTTGEEYLRRVRWEANRCPGIVVSDIDPKRFEQNKSRDYFSLPKPITAPPTGLAPPEEWQQWILEDFQSLIEYLENLYNTEKENLPTLPFTLPSAKDESQWYKLCFGKK